jgi:leukotriene-A4 hydrolase
MYVDLKGRDPDKCFTRVPYEKGALFLRHMEETFGRERFDNFVSGYFNHFAFQSITTADFIAYLKKNLLDKEPPLASLVSIDKWIYEPGIPSDAPKPMSRAFTEVERQAEEWLRGTILASNINTTSWTTHEWLHFLRYISQQLNGNKIRELDEAFGLTHSENAEIAHQWLLIAIANDYQPAYSRLRKFLISIGRRKLVKPLYKELIKTEEGKKCAMEIYSQARSNYHPIVVTTIDNIIGWRKE